MTKIRIRHGDNEIELEGSDAFIKKQLDGFYSRIKILPSEQARPIFREKVIEDAKIKAKGKTPTPAEYYKSKNKTDGISQILIFAKYLEEFRSTTEFSRNDLNKIAKEARLPKDIYTVYFTRAVQQGLLRSLGGGKYSITLSAEEALSSM